MASEITAKASPGKVAGEAAQAIPPELHPDIDRIVTEDDAPVDNIFSEKQQRLLTEPLYSCWSGPDGKQRFVALANVGLFFAIRQPPYVPDMLLSLDVELPGDLSPKANRSYFVWEYGKPPEVVVEVVSNREGGEDTVKLAGYARVGIRYYAILDPDRLLSEEPLRVYQLQGMDYRPADVPAWFPGVGLGMRLWKGSYEGHEDTWLRWTDEQGVPIPTGAERADSERQRAEQERQRADRLAEQLRQLGHDPNVP